MSKVIAKFKGGSLSSTSLISDNNNNLFVRKTVSLIEDREYGFQRWYSQLKRIQRFNILFPGLFPSLIDYGKENDIAFMDIEYISEAVNAQEYIKNCKNKDEIDKFMSSLIDAMKKMYSLKMPSSTKSISLYINEEIDQRLNDCYKENSFLELLKYDTIIFNGKEVKSFVNVLDEYKDMCNKYYNKSAESFTHGNITLENLLYVPEKNRVIFIDPYDENIIDSELAEFSQLLQSSNGKYEIYNSKSAIVKNNQISLEIEESFGINYFNNRLIKYLKENYSVDEYIMIRLFEISQFIRMLPFKMAIDKSKMIFFYGLASYLFTELKNEMTSLEMGV